MMLPRIEGRTAAIVPLFAVTLLAGQFTSGVNLVEVYATVTNQAGEPINGLTAADFRVAEDGAPQTITTFAAGEFPLSVAIGVDRSFSMGGVKGAGKGDRLTMAKSAAAAFIDALRPDDEVMIVAIGGETEVVQPLTSDRTAARAALDRLDSWGTTPLYDATVAALDAIQPARGRRALLLLSDGTDRYSDTDASTLLEKARRQDVLVYPVAIGSTRPPIFAELATATGGRSFFVQDPRTLSKTLVTVAHELRSQYLLGYAPTRPVSPEAQWRTIEVRVQRADARVRAREGYVGK